MSVIRTFGMAIWRWINQKWINDQGVVVQQALCIERFGGDLGHRSGDLWRIAVWVFVVEGGVGWR